jgi:hypothetical protein
MASTTGRPEEPGTYPLHEIAQVKFRGDDVPEAKDSQQEMVLAAWKVHLAVVAEAMRQSPGPVERDGVSGFIWTGELPGLFRNRLWPANESALPSTGQSHNSARIAVTRWLADKRVLLPVELGHEERRNGKGEIIAPAKQTRWWVSAEFKGAPANFRLPQADLGARTEAVSADKTQAAGVTAGSGQKNSAWSCREPDCQAPPFSTSVQRGAHEDREHAGSRFRIWKCPSCKKPPQSFYSQQGLGNHMSKLHDIISGTDTYEAIMAQIKAAQARRPVPLAPGSAAAIPAVIFPENEAEVTHPADPPPAQVPEPARPPRVAIEAEPGSRSLSGQLADLAGYVRGLEERNAELEKENTELRARAARAGEIARTREELSSTMERLKSLLK